MFFKKNISDTLKHYFYTDEKLSKLFCIKNNFLSILQNVAVYFVYLNILCQALTVIPQNDIMIHIPNQISLKYMYCIILHNTFLAAECMK